VSRSVRAEASNELTDPADTFPSRSPAVAIVSCIRGRWIRVLASSARWNQEAIKWSSTFGEDVRGSSRAIGRADALAARVDVRPRGILAVSTRAATSRARQTAARRPDGRRGVSWHYKRCRRQRDHSPSRTLEGARASREHFGYPAFAPAVARSIGAGGSRHARRFADRRRKSLCFKCRRRLPKLTSSSLLISLMKNR
jgi:hypothetical protein